MVSVRYGGDLTPDTFVLVQEVLSACLESVASAAASIGAAKGKQVCLFVCLFVCLDLSPVV